MEVVLRRHAPHVHEREFPELLPHSALGERFQLPQVVPPQTVQLD